MNTQTPVVSVLPHPPIPRWIQDDADFLAAYHYANSRHMSVNQIRKYTNEPYIVHPVEVAEIVRENALRLKYDAERIKHMVIAALLHDTVEDTGATYNEIEKMFGVEVRNLVFWLTDVTSKAQGNRRVRTELECYRLVNAPKDVKFIKLSDLVSNTRSIVEHDAKFAPTYLAEKQALVDAFTAHNGMWHDGYMPTKCEPSMLTLARNSIVEGRDKLSKP